MAPPKPGTLWYQQEDGDAIEAEVGNIPFEHDAAGRGPLVTYPSAEACEADLESLEPASYDLDNMWCRELTPYIRLADHVCLSPAQMQYLRARFPAEVDAETQARLACVPPVPPRLRRW